MRCADCKDARRGEEQLEREEQRGDSERHGERAPVEADANTFDNAAATTSAQTTSAAGKLICQDFAVVAMRDDFTGRAARGDKNLIWLSASAMLSRAKRGGRIRKTTSRLHRLDARTRLRADVPDALLRFVAGRRGARTTHFIGWSRLGGTLPAPLFLFLAGISCALFTDRMRQKGIAPGAIARTTIRRGAEIFGLGLLFRVQEFVLGQPWAPWTDLLRVDVLNVIGISTDAHGRGVLDGAEPRRERDSGRRRVALGIALATPPLWTTWRPRWLPWYLESYVNGVHTYNVPQPWLFPIFPWTAFAFAGLAVGFLAVQRMAGEESGARDGSLRRGWRGDILPFVMA